MKMMVLCQRHFSHTEIGQDAMEFFFSLSLSRAKCHCKWRRKIQIKKQTRQQKRCTISWTVYNITALPSFGFSICISTIHTADLIKCHCVCLSKTSLHKAQRNGNNIRRARETKKTRRIQHMKCQWKWVDSNSWKMKEWTSSLSLPPPPPLFRLHKFLLQPSFVDRTVCVCALALASVYNMQSTVVNCTIFLLLKKRRVFVFSSIFVCACVHFYSVCFLCLGILQNRAKDDEGKQPSKIYM